MNQREIDALVAEQPMGIKVHRLLATGGLISAYHGFVIPFYSTEIAAAMSVMERMLAGDKADKFVEALLEECPDAVLMDSPVKFTLWILRHLTPERICLAALKAHGVTLEQTGEVV